MGVERYLNDFDRRMDERKKREGEKREKYNNEAREKEMRNSKRNQERFSRLSGAQKREVMDDVLQPTGRTRDAFFSKYGYLPDVHGEPGSPGFDERRAKDLKLAQEKKHNAKLKRYY